MSNKNTAVINFSSSNKTKTKKTSSNKKPVKNFLQRITSGQSGVVLDVLF
ncbi:hypothetical protein [Vibrio sinaloensis]|nr:hypothetical protein [Vibrio sinaloensis]MCZ4292542.1 hypothetical protein [Vibrio sinaloensis]